MRSFIVTDPSSAEAPNEDAARFDARVAVLADGSGVPPRYRAGCHHTVAWYSHALVDALVEELADETVSMRAALGAAIRRVRRLHEDECDLEAGSPSATVVAARARGEVLEHLILCDSSLLLIGTDGEVTRVTDTRIEDVVRRERVPDAIEALRNGEGGFWVARHEERAAEEALVGSLPLAEVETAVIVSDGVTRAIDLLGLGDAAAVARRCRDAGDAAELIGEVRREETRRAAAGTLPERKTHDDATVLVWSPERPGRPDHGDTLGRS